MDAPERGALMLVRFVAVCLIGWTALDVALYWLVCEQKHVPMKTLPCIVKSLPFMIGLALLVKSKAVAQWISDKLGE